MKRYMVKTWNRLQLNFLIFKEMKKRFNVDESELERFEDSVEKRLFQIEEKMNSKDINNSASKSPSPQDILARVGKHFPFLVIFGNHGLVANCNKNYSDVSLPSTNDITLKEDHLDDQGRILMNIQGSLVGKHIRFQDWGEVLYSYYLINELNKNHISIYSTCNY
ncbi:Tkp3 protein [Vanderwaltozyma polyspora DSM 70294]|uniref:Tkp3 protein n=1 Tax=Vanderwaltozyma polyspora (strain ATCC 22028 / DSM 70294 / BCRC 21397 / CBS 2163 / NBRC 10782 / NRRL Y-8283 / UCD 57-17) TaxID=436907 RepID=A7TLR1_VANPO|nr:Tkp3 protein [Vanderwaltozyma polyspora DSM 70294]EDO16753.1 Tkp3 protein [Vanderwaltozyma polyspora DSM 70294]